MASSTFSHDVAPILSNRSYEQSLLRPRLLKVNTLDFGYVHAHSRLPSCLNLGSSNPANFH
ncbi:hypothetical protein RHIZ404_230466 [Rhizobium sp. EC-SD404]|nr:hypothetical protein RHIZ404_230466 [Rhizobium sp. EC-SD404]